MTYHDKEPYVVLRHDEWQKMVKDYVRNPENRGFGSLCIWHFEPKSKFVSRPPENKHWILFHECVGFDSAAKFVENMTEKYVKEFTSVFVGDKSPIDDVIDDLKCMRRGRNKTYSNESDALEYQLVLLNAIHLRKSLIEK